MLFRSYIPRVSALNMSFCPRDEPTQVPVEASHYVEFTPAFTLSGYTGGFVLGVYV